MYWNLLMHCDLEVFKQKRSVFVVRGIRPNLIDAWVKRVAALSGQRVGWHFFPDRKGRQCVAVKTNGNRRLVERTIDILLPELIALSDI